MRCCVVRRLFIPTAPCFLRWALVFDIWHEARAAAGTALQGAAAGQRVAVEEDGQAGTGDAAACSC